jgi:hypothetical protein
MPNGVPSQGWRAFVAGLGLALAFGVLLVLNSFQARSAEPVTLSSTAIRTLQITQTPTSTRTTELATSTTGPTPYLDVATVAPAQLPVYYDRPDWLKNPGSATLLAITFDKSDAEYVTLIDAKDKQRFDIAMSNTMEQVKWAFTNRGWALDYVRDVDQPDNTRAYYHERLILETGEVERVSLPPGPAQTNVFYDETIHGSYEAAVQRDKELYTVVLTNRETGDALTLPDPFGGYYKSRVDLIWAPTQDLLAVVRYNFWDDPSLSPETGLAIYNTSGQVYREYNNLRDVAWAPDGSLRLLISDGPYFGENIPCILDLIRSSKTCPTSVSSWKELHGARVDFPAWTLPNGQAVSFGYWNGERSGICVAEILLTKVTCPVNSKNFGLNHYVVSYGWSSDGQYLWLLDNIYGPGSDDWTEVQLITTDKDGQGLTVWGHGIEAQWRPAAPFWENIKVP